MRTTGHQQQALLLVDCGLLFMPGQQQPQLPRLHRLARCAERKLLRVRAPRFDFRQVWTYLYVHVRRERPERRRVVVTLRQLLLVVADNRLADRPMRLLKGLHLQLF